MSKIDVAILNHAGNIGESLIERAACELRLQPGRRRLDELHGCAASLLIAHPAGDADALFYEAVLRDVPDIGAIIIVAQGGLKTSMPPRTEGNATVLELRAKPADLDVAQWKEVIACCSDRKSLEDVLDRGANESVRQLFCNPRMYGWATAMTTLCLGFVACHALPDTKGIGWEYPELAEAFGQMGLSLRGSPKRVLLCGEELKSKGDLGCVKGRDYWQPLSSIGREGDDHHQLVADWHEMYSESVPQSVLRLLDCVDEGRFAEAVFRSTVNEAFCELVRP